MQKPRACSVLRRPFVGCVLICAVVLVALRTVQSDDLGPVAALPLQALDARQVLWPLPASVVNLKAPVPLPRHGFAVANHPKCSSVRRALKDLALSVATKQELTGSSLASSHESIRVDIIVKKDAAVAEPQHLVDADESYSLDVDASGVSIKANTCIGAAYALQTLSQLVVTSKSSKSLQVLSVRIKDRPHFPYRGFMLDTARNFFTVDDIKQIIRGCAYSKLNVLHWHIYDSNSFPILWKKYPQLLSAAYRDAAGIHKLYSKHDIQDLVQFAFERNIRIIPEFEFPGHNGIFGHIDASLIADWKHSPWDGGNGMPANTSAEPGTIAYRRGHCAAPPCGQLDVRLPRAMELIEELVADVGSWFPDPVLHVGHDEVNARAYGLVPDEWDQVPTDAIHPLMQEFEPKLLEILKRHGKSYGAWDEVATDFGIERIVPKHGLITLWRNITVLTEIIDKGFTNIVLAPQSHYYLDCSPSAVSCLTPYERAYPTKSYDMPGFTARPGQWHNWTHMTLFDPLAGLTRAQAKSVRGGFAALWSETIKRHNLQRYAFPRAAVVAERLWSYAATAAFPLQVTERRLKHFRASLVNELGIDAATLDYLGNEEGTVYRPESCDGDGLTADWQKTTRAGAFSGMPVVDLNGDPPAGASGTYYKVFADYCGVAKLYDTNAFVPVAPEHVPYEFEL